MRGDNVSSTLSQSPAEVKLEEKTELSVSFSPLLLLAAASFPIKRVGGTSEGTSISLMERGEAIIVDL